MSRGLNDVAADVWRAASSVAAFIAGGILCLAAMSRAADDPDATFDLEQVATLLEFVLEADEATAVECLNKIIQRAQTGELSDQQLASLRTQLAEPLKRVWSADRDSQLSDAALQLAVLWKDSQAADRARSIVAAPQYSAQRRGLLLNTLAVGRDPQTLQAISRLLQERNSTAELQASALTALARFDDEKVAAVILEAYSRLEASAQAQAITVLTQRPAWSRQLVAAVRAGQIPATAVGLTHLRSLLASRDRELVSLVKQQWGAVREERNPQREQVIEQMRGMLAKSTGDAIRGEATFHRVCGQCHKIHGVGQEVGPDITSNGRSNYDQLLSNVFDPSLVIGPSYQAVTVITADGRIVTGLLAEDSQQRIALKTQGGKVETIPREDVEEVAPSKLSLMPENLEQQLKPDELADLFSFLTLDKPPRDPDAKRIAGAPQFAP